MTGHILFLPGLMCDHRLFAPQIAAMERDATCHTGQYAEDDTIADIATAALARCDAPVHVVGLSMGGIVGLHMATHMPARVASLTLIDTTSRADAPQNAPIRNAQIRAVQNGGLADVMRTELKPNYIYDPDQHGDILATCMDMALDLGPATFVAQSSALRDRMDYRPLLSRITCPTLIICGANDTLCPVDRHAEIAQAIPRAQLHVIKDCGHLATLEQPSQVTHLIHDFLTKDAQCLKSAAFANG